MANGELPKHGKRTASTGFSAKTVRLRQKNSRRKFSFQRLCKTSKRASMVLMFGTCILTGPIKVRTGKKKEGGGLFRLQCFKITFFPKHKILQSALLLNCTSYNAEPTLRLFGIMAFTKYVDFNLING